MQEYHLVKRANLWRLEEEGSEQALLTAATKAEALEQTEAFMNEHRGTVWIHKADGDLQDERIYELEATTGRRSSALTWATVLTLGITFAAGCALVWYYRKDLGRSLRQVDLGRSLRQVDLGKSLRQVDLDRLRGLLSR